MSAIHEVAKRAGVAPITVSRVINNNGYVSDETRRRVEQAIQELNYIPNSLGPSLRSKQTKTLALVLPDIVGYFFGPVARGAEDAANRLGYHIILGNTDSSEAKLEDYLMFLTKKQVDGFIFVPTSDHLPRFFKRYKIPFVTLDRKVVETQVNSVRGDSFTGGYLLTKHLLELGHRQITVITGPQDHSTAYERAMGAVQACKDAGWSEPPPILWTDYEDEESYIVAKQVLATSPRPTAIFATAFGVLNGTLRAVREAKLRIPDDISVVAFDDIPTSIMEDPFLTVAIQPTYEMGGRAVELLVEQLTKDKPIQPQEIVMPVKLIVRKSSGKPASGT